MAEAEDADCASIKETLVNGDRIVLTMKELDESEALQHVRKAEAGATVLFVGTTRNEFKGKQVGHLEYSAYSSLAKKVMQTILQEARSKSEEVKSIYLAHRLGHVPTTQSSILVCVSSAHRKEAFEICEEILEQVKKQVPIWKKEIYVGQNAGEAEWKANF
jgi:molybdopterin synthase catalytic subunit